LIRLTNRTLAALIATVCCVLSGCGHPKPVSASTTRDVERAYLAWWGTRKAAYLTLDTTPLRADASAAGMAADEQRMATLRDAGHLLRLSAEHATQTVVYRDGATASVDDVWVDHSVELDPGTMSPVQPDPDLVVHESTTLRLRGGRWIVDGVWRFGNSRPLPDSQVSWAAVAGGRPLPDFYRTPIEDAYRKAAPAGAQHNERAAIEQDSVAWVYDTIAKGSSVTHTATRLVQEAGAWTVQAG